MRFRTKLALISTLGVIILSACTVWPILGLIGSSFDRLASSNFAGMRQGLDSMQAQRVSHMRQLGNLIMEIPDLRALIAEENYEISADNIASLQDRLNDLTKAMDVGFICVLDSRGALIAQNSASPWKSLADLRQYAADSPQAASLLHQIYVPRASGRAGEKDQFGLWPYHGQVYQVVGLPLVFGRDDASQGCDGAMIIASPITSDMAHSVADSHHCQLTFLTTGGGVISSLPPDQSRALDRARAASQWKPASTFDIALAGTNYRSYVEPMIDPCSQTTVGQVISQTSLGEWSALQSRISQRLLSIVVGGTCIAVLASLLLSKAITRPMRELLRGVRRVADGDLATTIAVPHNDEIGELASAFNNMLTQLQARRQLEIRVAESQAASKTKSQFLANMSHEIRTPLHGVIGMANLLLGTNLSDRQRHYAQLVKSSSEVLTTLINDILDFSKIEAGKLELESVEFDLHSVVEDAVELLYQKAIGKGVEIVCDIQADVPARVVGDPTRLRQVLLNLVGNAVKFTERGQVVVRVAADSRTADAALLRFSIIDTGIGIAPEAVARLFHSFSQVDASTTRRFGGTGLGLAICKQLCELMGGGIGVESKVGQGSTFWFTANVKAAPAPAPAVPPLPHAPILVADANPAVRETIARQLAILGADPIAAAGDEACRLIAEAHDAGRPIAAIIASRSIAGFATLLHEASERAIPRVLLASGSDHTDSAVLLEAGFAAAVIKPVRRSALLPAMAQALGIADKTRRKQSAPDSDSGPASAPRAARVLVAEDNEINQIVAEEFLGNAGFHTRVVKDGQEAVNALDEGQFDIVLMDCQMPVMDGFAATKLIRQRECERQTAGEIVVAIPIVALTANASRADRGKCMAAGMNAYCSKPFRERELLDTIAKLLAARTPDRPEDGPALPETNAANASDDPPAPGEPGGPQPGLPPRASAHPSAANETAALNAAAVLERCSGNAALALTVLDKFQAQIADLADQLQEHVRREDPDQLARSAHAVKGAAGIMGAEPLRLVLAELEHLGRQNALAAAGDCLARLREEIARCNACIPQARSALQPPTEPGTDTEVLPCKS